MIDVIDELDPNTERSKHDRILEKLYDIENEELSYSKSTGSFLPSSFLPKLDQDNQEDDIEESDDWFNELMEVSSCKPRSYKKGKDLFDFNDGKKKKKKKKKKGDKELVDYSKEFETEIALYRNLLQDQNKFTDSLQDEYNAIKGVKSSARGVNKTLNDLVQNITDARTLAMQLVEKNVNVKKLIADLTLKQKKELGSGDGEGENMADLASTYLKKMLTDRKNAEEALGSDEIVSYDDGDDLYDALTESLGDDNDEDSDSQKYLEYENKNVTVYIIINDSDTSEFRFQAKDEDDNIIEDYPLPMSSKISINRSTNIATDEYGKKYSIIWE